MEEDQSTQRNPTTLGRASTLYCSHKGRVYERSKDRTHNLTTVQWLLKTSIVLTGYQQKSMYETIGDFLFTQGEPGANGANGPQGDRGLMVGKEIIHR